MRIAFLPWPTSTCNQNQSEHVHVETIHRRIAITSPPPPRFPFQLTFPCEQAHTKFPSAKNQIHPHIAQSLTQNSFTTTNTRKKKKDLTSRAETNCKGRRVAFKSCVLLSKSNRAPPIADSSSEGFCLDGELTAILLIAAMVDEREENDEGREVREGRWAAAVFRSLSREGLVVRRANCACLWIGCSAARLAVPACARLGLVPLRARCGT